MTWTHSALLQAVPRTEITKLIKQTSDVEGFRQVSCPGGLLFTVMFDRAAYHLCDR